MIISPNLPQQRVLRNEVFTPPSPAFSIAAYPDWLSVELNWVDDSSNWYDPCVLQRSNSATGFSTPNLGAAQDPDSNFIWIGNNGANQYTDIDLSLEGSTKYYRVAYVTNWPDVVRNSATPVYTDWQYGEATMPSRTSSQSQVLNLVDDYGASTSGNIWSAVKSAFADAIAAGGKKIYLPAGTYDLYPTDSAVKWDGQFLTVGKDQSFARECVNGKLSNIEFYGDGIGSTIINCKMWRNKPATNWLNILHVPSGNPNNDSDISDIIRYGLLETTDMTENFVFRDMTVDGTADPVRVISGSRTNTNKKFGWDLTHKVVAGYNVSARNIYWKNIKAINWRAEMAYWGGFRLENYKLEGCTLGRSNSSITSMSSGIEFINCVCEDTSNGCVENVPHSKTNNSEDGIQLISKITGRPVYHNSIIRDCVFDPIKSGGVFESMDINEDQFAGIYIFNQEGTFCTITDSTIRNCRTAVFAPWHEARSWFVNNVDVDTPYGECHIWSFKPSRNTEGNNRYKLSGDVTHHYYSNIDITLGSENMDGTGAIFRCNNLNNAGFDNVIMDKIDLDGNGRTAQRLWWDKDTTDRTDFKCRDWTLSNLTQSGQKSIVNNTGDNLPLPEWEDFDFGWHRVGDSTPRVDWGQMEIDGTRNITSISNINELKVGSTVKFRSKDSGETQTYKANSSWNTFTRDYQVTGSQVLTCNVVRVGTPKLQYVSLA